MAKSYYKQSERPVVEGVNWGQISSDLGAKLQAESKRREDLKTQLDTESRDYIREFNDTPQGQHDGANERMSRFADDASMYMLDLDKKLKAGQLPLRDYNAMRANLQQGTTDMFEVSKKFNADYGASLERAGSGNASAEEIYQNQQIQAFGDPANSGVYIDPVSGQMSVAKMVDDGDGNMVMSSNPSDRKSIFSLKNTVERKIDNFNVNEFSEGIKGAYDVKYQRVIESGDVGLLNDMKKNPDFVKATNDLISRELVNTHNAASILTNRAGKEYRFETLPNNKLPDVQEEGVIYLVPDPTNPNSGASQPLLTEKQTNEATEILRTSIDSKIGVTETSSLEVKRESQKLANEQSQQAIDFFEDTKNLKKGKLILDNEAAEQRISVIAQKTPLELKAMGLSNEKLDQVIKHLALKNPKELETMDLSIENTEAIMKERATKHDSDMAAAKTKEEKERIELKYLDEEKKLRNIYTEAQITKINKPTQWEAKDNKEKKLVSNYVSKIGHVFDGSESQIDAALNYISNANRDITSIERNNNEVVIEMFDVDGKTPIVKRIPIDNKRDFVESMSALVANELNVVDIMDDMGYDDQGTYTDYDASTTVQTTEEKEAGYKKEISVIVDSAISRDMFDNIDKESDFKTELLRLTEVGGSLEAFDDMVIETSKDATGKIISNEIYISFPDEETSITIDTNNWTDSGDTDEMKKLRDFLKERGKSDASNMAKFYGFDKEGYESPDEVNYEDGKVDYTKK